MTLPAGPFGTIVADPPWRYPSPGAFTRSTASVDRGLSGQAAAGTRYGLLDLAAIQALPVKEVAATQAHLYLWTTNAFMAEAYEVARSWGFQPVTILTWGKVKADGSPSMKMGYYFRGATEHVLFATRGPALRLSSREGIPTLMLERRLPHSEKPDAFYQLVERISPGPRVDLFARRERPGWAAWGDEL